MKTLLFIMFFLFLQSTSIAQGIRVDSLINQLNNSQVGFNGDYAGATIDLRGEPSISLYNIGKPATEKLISVLEDSTKGIIAHIILTWIWGKTERPRTILSQRDKLVVYTYNELDFFVRLREAYANEYDLKLNRLKWLAFIRQNGR